MNEYERAIFEVGQVLEPYTLEGNFHMLGFGGQPGYLEDPEENDKPSKCWNLTGKPFKDVLGGRTGSTSEMLRTYHNAIMQTKLRGPTYFKPIIDRFIQIARAELKEYKQLYFIFVILTDGAIHDMEETKRALVEMSKEPISVIIVGMGENQEDFADMRFLDADNEALYWEDKTIEDEAARAATRLTAVRDIAQFVKFAEMQELARVEVSENLLQEVPHHFVDYMVLR